MTRSIRRTLVVSAAAVVGLLWAHALTQAQDAPAPKRTVLLQHDTSAPGFEAALVAVEIPPGAREGRHTHPGLAIVHVQEGTLTLEYEGKPTASYMAGQSFFVEAGKVHEGINRGATTVKAIASFVIEKGKPITTQVPGSTTK
jgi:quercetin dioxygenase-like cupin family protein